MILAAALRVEVAGGLVGEQHLKVGDQRARSPHVAAAGEFWPACGAPSPTKAQRNRARLRVAQWPARCGKSSSSTFSCALARASRLMPWKTSPGTLRRSRALVARELCTAMPRNR